MKTTIIAALLFATTAHAGVSFGTSLPCDGFTQRELGTRKLAGFYCCRALTYDGPDLVWVRTCFAVRRHGRIGCVTTDVLNRDRTLRRVIFDGCGIDEVKP